VLVVCAVAQIAPTNTTCQQFLGGTAGSLTEVTYQTHGTATIQGAQPGVFFYFVKVVAPAASFTVDVPQSIQSGTGPLFAIKSTSAFDQSCNSFLSIKASGAAADDVIKFTNATAGQTYVVAIKYSPKSIVGQPKPSPANITYVFTTNLNGSAVSGSQQKLKLVKTG